MAIPDASTEEGAAGSAAGAGAPDRPLPRGFQRLLWEDAEAFPGQVGDVISPHMSWVCPGLSSFRDTRGRIQLRRLELVEQTAPFSMLTPISLQVLRVPFLLLLHKKKTA